MPSFRQKASSSHPMDRPIAESRIDGAVLTRIGAAVGVGVVDHGVLGFPEELVRIPSQHFGSGRVDERGESLPVQAVDALTRRAQDQLPVPPQLFEGLLRSTSLGQVAQRFVTMAFSPHEAPERDKPSRCDACRKKAIRTRGDSER